MVVLPYLEVPLLPVSERVELELPITACKTIHPASLLWISLGFPLSFSP